MANDYPGWNYVMCHTDHAAKFDGTQGTDWDHLHQEFDIVIGGTVGYEVYYGKGGSFELYGDGGYLNVSFVICCERKAANSDIHSSGHTEERS